MTSNCMILAWVVEQSGKVGISEVRTRRRIAEVESGILNLLIDFMVMFYFQEKYNFDLMYFPLVIGYGRTNFYMNEVPKM